MSELVKKWDGHPPPEHRLTGAIIAGPLLVIGCFWLGWTGEYSHVRWYVPMLATIPIGCAINLMFISFLVSHPFSFAELVLILSPGLPDRHVFVSYFFPWAQLLESDVLRGRMRRPLLVLTRLSVALLALHSLCLPHRCSKGSVQIYSPLDDYSL